MQFQFASDIDVGSSLKLVESYFGSSVTMVQYTLFLQKRGIRTGSRVAPFLSEIHICIIDIIVSQLLETYVEGPVIVRMYVDNILLCSLDSLSSERVKGHMERKKTFFFLTA